MRNASKLFIAVLVCVWIGVIGGNLKEYSSERKAESSNPTTSVTQNYTAVIGTVPYSQMSTEQITDVTDAPTESSDETTSAQNTTEEASEENTVDYEKIVTMFNNAMNGTKSAQRTCNVTAVSTVKINVTDCSVPAALNAINGIIQRFAADNKVEQMLFTNGVSEDGLTIFSQLPPMGKMTSLTVDGVASATCEEYGNGNKITITVVPETASLEQPPVHHASSIGYLDAAALDIPATITQADMVYPGATITICINADGLMDSYERVYPMSGSGTAKVGPLSGSASFEGSLEDKWTFDWA